jgi:hypothetical protein
MICVSNTSSKTGGQYEEARPPIFPGGATISWVRGQPLRQANESVRKP